MTALLLSAGLPAPQAAQAGEETTLRADRAEFSEDGGHASAEGGAVLATGGIWIRADRIDYGLGDQSVSAQGDLVLVDGNLVLTGESASMTLGRPETLRIESARLFQKEQPVTAADIEEAARKDRGTPSDSGTQEEPPGAPAPAADDGAEDAKNAERAEASAETPDPHESEAADETPGDAPTADKASPQDTSEQSGASEPPPPRPQYSDTELASWRSADALAGCSGDDMGKSGRNALVVQAGTIERGRDGFKARDLRLTSCACPSQDKPDWSLGASSAEIEPGEGALLWWPTFRIRDVPVLGFPLLYVPLSPRKTGFLFPNIKFSSSGGFGAEIPFFLTLGRSYDLTFTPGFLTKPILALSNQKTQRESAWGPRGAVEFRYAPHVSTRGKLKFSGILDRGFDTLDEGRERRGFRGELVFRHRTRFDSGLGFFADAAGISDARYLSDISDNLLAGATSYLSSSARAFWQRDDFELTLGTLWFQDLATARSGVFTSEASLFGQDSPAPSQRPGFFLAQMPTRAIAGPLRLGGELSVSHLRPVAMGGTLDQERLTASARMKTAADFFALTRIDLAPRLHLPFLRTGPIRGDLAIGARGDFSAWTPVMSGHGESFTDVWGRAYADLGFSTELSRVFGQGNSALRHTISPSIRLRASSREFGTRDGELDGDEALDALDAMVVPLDELDTANRAASPRLLQGVAAVRTRLAKPNGDTPLALVLGQGVDFTSMQLGETFGELSTGFRWVAASVGARFDPELKKFSLIQGKFRLSDPRGDFLSAAYDLLRGSGTSLMRQGLDDLLGAAADPEADSMFQQINLGVGVTIVPMVAVSYSIRIDPGAAQREDRVLLHTAALRLKGKCNCWSLDLGADWAPVSERWSAKFLLTLKNLGSFGTNN